MGSQKVGHNRVTEQQQQMCVCVCVCVCVCESHSVIGLERSPGDRKAYPLQYFGLENSMDCIAQGVAKSQTRLRPQFNSWVGELIIYINGILFSHETEGNPVICDNIDET